jgi:RNA polymerase sigma-70 factor (ECF subfamily)
MEDVTRLLTRILHKEGRNLAATAPVTLLGGDRESWFEPEDALQLAVLKILTGRARCREPDRLRAFLVTAIRNELRNRGRSGDARTVDLDDIQLVSGPSPTVDPLLAVELHESMDRAREVLDQELSDRQRDVFLLREWKGLPWAEIASRLGIKEETAKVHGRRARRKLKAWRERSQRSEVG